MPPEYRLDLWGRLPPQNPPTYDKYGYKIDIIKNMTKLNFKKATTRF